MTISLHYRKSGVRVGLLALTLVFLTPQLDAAPEQFELRGKVLREDGQAFRRIWPVVFLHSATTPFMTQTRAGPGGGFKFKNLPTGTYTLTILVPRQGEMHQTVEIGPSFSDEKGRIDFTLHFQSNLSPAAAQIVSVRQLALPDKAIREYQKARKSLDKRKFDKAIQHLEKAVDLAPQFAEAWNLLGTIAYQERDLDQAEQCFREAVKQAPELYAPMINLAGALLSSGKLDESLPLNLRAIELKPEDPLAHSQLGQNYFRLGHLEKAEWHLQRAKSIDPRHFTFPQLTLAEIYKLRQKTGAVSAELDEFLRYHPDSELAPRLRQMLKQLQVRHPR